MSRKVLLDQGIPYSTSQLLKDADWDVEHTVDIDMSRATDREIIDYAQQEGRAVRGRRRYYSFYSGRDVNKLMGDEPESVVNRK